MPLKFKCEHCDTDVIVKFLKKGEKAECKFCEKQTKVPEDAVGTEDTVTIKRNTNISNISEDRFGSRGKNMSKNINDQPNEGEDTTNVENHQKSANRPRSLAITSIFILLLFGGGYILAVGSLITGAQGLTFSRLIVEPPEDQGGIPWPGWAEISSMMKGEMDIFDALAAKYWLAKLKMAGSMLVVPLFIIGFLGVYIGREWGRTCLYVYVSAWLANKVIYLILMGAEGVFKFSMAIGMAVFLVIVLRSKSWSSWIEQKLLFNE